VRAQLDIPDRMGAAAVDAALEGLVQLGVAELGEHEASGEPMPALYESGARYEREHGTENWLLPSQVIAAGRGDCEDLAAFRAAELRVTGEDPEARAHVIRSGPRTWHAVVGRGDGSTEDPSRRLGMNGDSVGIGDWSVTCARVPGGWQCTLAREGQGGVVGQSRYAHDAMARACVFGSHLGALELGQIPGLDIASRALSAALSTVVPGLIPPIPPIPSRVPTESATELDATARRIALQIQRIATTEARRKIREARSIVSAGAARTKREELRAARAKARADA